MVSRAATGSRRPWQGPRRRALSTAKPRGGRRGRPVCGRSWPVQVRSGRSTDVRPEAWRRESPMLFGKREPRSAVARRHGAFRPQADRLEGRILMAVDVGGSTPPNLPVMATAPLGVIEAGATQAGGAGFSVTDVG